MIDNRSPKPSEIPPEDAQARIRLALSIISGRRPNSDLTDEEILLLGYDPADKRSDGGILMDNLRQELELLDQFLAKHNVQVFYNREDQGDKYVWQWAAVIDGVPTITETNDWQDAYTQAITEALRPTKTGATNA